MQCVHVFTVHRNGFLKAIWWLAINSLLFWLNTFLISSTTIELQLDSCIVMHAL